MPTSVSCFSSLSRGLSRHSLAEAPPRRDSCRDAFWFLPSLTASREFGGRWTLGRLRSWSAASKGCMEGKEWTQQDGVEPIRKALFAELAEADHLHSARLEFLFAQDLFARSAFSEGVVTSALATLSAEWVRGQLRARQALWPLDASPDKYERVYLTLLKAFEKTPTMSLRDMKKACHTDRAGSGGLQALTSQIATMMRAGEIV